MISLDLRNITKGLMILDLDKGSFIQKSSTYYFAVDADFMPESDSIYKVLSCLKVLVSNWIKCVDSISENNRVAYLPFDFSDEYLGCLKIEFVAKEYFQIEYGYTEEIKGYSFNPSNIGCLSTEIVREYEGLSVSFKYSSKELLVELEKIVLQVNTSLVELS